MPKCFVYLAKCDGGSLGICFYVGTWAGKNPETRFNMHRSGEGGSRFCQTYKPFAFEVLGRFATIRKAQIFEQRTTEDYMIKFGFRNVRGGDCLNMRSDCYQLRNLRWWLTGRLQPYLLSGELGSPDPEPLVEAY